MFYLFSKERYIYLDIDIIERIIQSSYGPEIKAGDGLLISIDG